MSFYIDGKPVSNDEGITWLMNMAEKMKAEIERLQADFDARTETYRRDVDRLVSEAERLGSENKRYKEREEYFAKALHVADGGQYRADWDGAISNVLERLNKVATENEKLSEALDLVRTKALDLVGPSFSSIRVEANIKTEAWTKAYALRSALNRTENVK